MRGTGLPNPFREIKFSGANADRDIFIFPVQLTKSRIANLTRLIHTLAICVTIRTNSSRLPFVRLLKTYLQNAHVDDNGTLKVS